MYSLEHQKIKNEPADEDMNSSKPLIVISDESIANSNYVKISTTNTLISNNTTTVSRTELDNILPLNNAVSHELLEVKDTTTITSKGPNSLESKTSVDKPGKPTIFHPSTISGQLMHLESKSIKTEPAVENDFYYSSPINIAAGRSLLKYNYMKSNLQKDSLQSNDTKTFSTTELDLISKASSDDKEREDIAEKSFSTTKDLKDIVSNYTNDLNIQNSSNAMFTSNTSVTEMAISKDPVILIPFNMYICSQEGNYGAKTDYLLPNVNGPVSSCVFLPHVQIPVYPVNEATAMGTSDFNVAQMDRSISDANTNYLLPSSSCVSLTNDHIPKHSEVEGSERNTSYSNDDQAVGSNSSMTKVQETLAKLYMHIRSQQGNGYTETDYLLSKGSNSSCVLPYDRNSEPPANGTVATDTNNFNAIQLNRSIGDVNADYLLSKNSSLSCVPLPNDCIPKYSAIEGSEININNSKDVQTSKLNSSMTKVQQTLAEMHMYIRSQQANGEAKTDYLLSKVKSSSSSSILPHDHILESSANEATTAYTNNSNSDQMNRSVAHSNINHSLSKDSDSTCVPVPNDRIPKHSAIESSETNTNYSKDVQLGKSNYSMTKDGQSLADLLDPLYEYFVGNKCLLCGFISKEKKNSGRRHLATHLKTRNFKCNICGKCFKTPNTLHSHRTLIHNTIKEFVCNDCGQTFLRKCSLRNHIIKTHNCPQKHICSICDKQFARLRYLKEHLRIHTGEKPYKCTVCGQAFRTNEALKTHSAHHNPEKRHICTVCNKSYNKKMFLKEHMNTHKGSPSYECDICGKMFNFKSNLIQHKLVHSDTRKHSCETCGMKFKLPHHLKSHILTHESK